MRPLLTADVSKKAKDFRLKDALHVPDLRANLLSVEKITDKSFTVTFDKDITINDDNGVTRLVADGPDGRTCEAACNSTVIEPLEVWHRCMEHLNEKYLIEAVKNHTVSDIELKKQEEKLSCDICLKGKDPFGQVERKGHRIAKNYLL